MEVFLIVGGVVAWLVIFFIRPPIGLLILVVMVSLAAISSVVEVPIFTKLFGSSGSSESS